MKEHHGSEKKRHIWIVPVLSVLMALFLGLAWHHYGSRFMASIYFSTDNVDMLFSVMHDEKVMFDPKLSQKYESAYLGNENANLQMFGYYCQCGNMICKSEEQTVLIIGEIKIVIDQAPSKYINIWNNVVYYRSDADKLVYAYDIGTAQKTCIIDTPCGQMAVSAKGISYIDLASSQLMYLPWQPDKSAKSVSDIQIESFAVLGDAYLCLDAEKSLGMLHHNGLFKLIDDEVDRFLYNGSIILQKGDLIYCMSRLDQAKRVQWDSGIVMGFDGDHFFVNEGKSIVQYSVSDHTEATTIYEFDITSVIKYFYAAQDEYFLTLCKKDDSLFVTEYISLDRVHDDH